jgi:hypothetical protein
MGFNDDMTMISPEPKDSNKFSQVPPEEPSGFQETPKFEPAPVFQEPPQPTDVPAYGQVVDPPQKKSSKTIWIIVAIVVVLICCCCIVSVVGISSFMKEMDIDNLEELMDEFSQIIRLAPAIL